MSVTEDLINFDIIETHKENIQSLPGGRSAKALASTFAPSSRYSAPTPGDTRNLNDAIRQEYELEILAIADSDDPLDVYDRYVKWTLSAYPSAQATPESQLRPLLERATKAFQSIASYKNDPRYLKLWLHYIRFFSDAPRETFAYLARHNIGEGLALFYEEFAAWLEGAGRWTQADEVYRLGMEREARPTERLARKFREFQQRFEQRVSNGNEPLSPALPTVRPALAAKLDPFAASTPRVTDPQAQRPAGIRGSSISRGGRQKLAIFSDADATASTSNVLSSGTKGWENIGSLSERKKENTVEARPWVGETLKTGKKTHGPPKMMVFRDESNLQLPESKKPQSSKYADQQQVANAKTGKVERVFVNLEAVYPNADDTNEEMSFEELRAQSRGWLSMDWTAEKHKTSNQVLSEAEDTQLVSSPTPASITEDPQTESQKTIAENDVDNKTKGRESKTGRSKKMKVMEVKGETQTVKTNLVSPTGPKLKRKHSAEPTMTLHTKAATDDILDIFNQPLRNMGPMGGKADSVCDSDFDDDDYTSAGESTGTGRISEPSEYGGDDTDARSVVDRDETSGIDGSPWSDFTRSKHVPKVDHLEVESEDDQHQEHATEDFVILDDGTADEEANSIQKLVTPTESETREYPLRTKFIPLPPEDYEAPTHPYRDPSQVSQNRLPFMTPIVEKTESSMGALTIREEKDYFNSKTPSRQHGDGSVGLRIEDELPSSPFEQIINEARAGREKGRLSSPVKSISRPLDAALRKGVAPASPPSGPTIKDAQCNPVDDSIRQSILANTDTPLAAYAGFYDHRPRRFNKGPEIRKFVKALAKVSKNSADKTATNLSLPPTIEFPKCPSKSLTMKREIGKGAFAPVYLAELALDEDAEIDGGPTQLAVKCEDPPTAWEFYIMSTLRTRLGVSSRPYTSILEPYSLHLFADEGYLLEEYLDQGTLLDLVNMVKAEPSGVLDEAVAMFFTVELLRTVEGMHAQGILHGDLKADNCLVRLSSIPQDKGWDSQYHRDGSCGWASKGLSLIDFGRGIDMRHFRPDVQFVADWKTSKADCAEMRELRPWTWQVDYWGMAGVVHSLLFGKYIEDMHVDAHVAKDASGLAGELAEVGIKTGKMKRYKLKESLKRYWQTELWASLFELLLNPTAHTEEEEGGKMPITKGLRGCRVSMEDWLEGEAGRKGLKNSLRRMEERVKESRRK